VVDDGVGRLYEPGDARAAGAALVDVLGASGRAAALGAQGRRRAEDRFGLEAARARWLEAVGPPSPPVGRAAAAGEGLALVVVTHNSAAHLAPLLASAARHLPAAHVVVADSASEDGSAEVARGFPGTAVLELADNVGFGTACNRALGEVEEPVVALLNADVELLDDSVERLAEEVSRDDRPERILAPLVLRPDGSRQDSVHPAPLSAPDLVRALVPPGALPGPLGRPLAPWRASRPRRVGWAVGCCLVARAATLRRLGPFDERIFLYAEDLDLGLTATERGVETWFWPESRVLHHRAHSSDRTFGGEPFELLARQRRRIIASHFGARRARLDDAAQLATFASRLALKRILRRDAGRERRQLRALRRAWREPFDAARAR
jgi:GT2 family glycosyltransferase